MSNWLEYHEEPVRLHSGDWSHWLVRGDLLFDDAPLREIILAFWVSNLEAWGEGQFDIQGIPTGGTRWADALRDRLPDSSGEGFKYYIAVDDVTTTGVSFDEVVSHGRLAVVDRRPVTKRIAHSVAAWATLNLPTFKNPNS